MELSSPLESPWPKEVCLKYVEELRVALENEKRSVRNWNEGLEGDASPALVAALKGVRENIGHEESVTWFVEAGLVELIAARLRRCPPADERPLLRWGLYATYASAPGLRPALRAVWGRELAEFARAPTWRWVIAPLLGALRCVIDGMASPAASTDAVVSRLVADVLAPLHRPNEYAEWRDQLPLFGTYHAELSACMVAAIRKVSKAGSAAVRAVLDSWPTIAVASTSKEIALLGELEELLTARESQRAGSPYALCEACFDDVLAVVLNRLSVCISSENWRLVERALHMWRREDFVSRFARRAKETCAHVLPALLRDGAPHWNPTVNRMTVLVIDRLAAMGDRAFEAAAKTLAAPNKSASPNPAATKDDTPAPAVMHEPPAMAAVGSLTRDMRGWRPGSGAPPPASVTGVAPWATSVPVSHHQSRGGGRVGVGETTTTTTTTTLGSIEEGDDGMTRVRKFKAACATLAAQSGGGFGGTTAEESQKEWAAQLTAEAPLRLPELKFHDLVFGRELGTGAFGVVKYAKRIVRVGEKAGGRASGDPSTQGVALSRAHWPDFAVKVVSRQKVEFHRYEGSIAREICVLRELNHPGVARLVSAFKWRDDVYLVLEYAGGGDLHETIAADGALDLPSTRFVVGSIVAALQSIHDAGFVYADLKPENVLLTSAGHVKLTDFGACRGATPEARDPLDEAAAQALATLRDGDWRDTTTTTSATKAAAAAGERGDHSQRPPFDADDYRRVEGTVLYLSPEVVRGAAPGPAADVWALGCVVHFCVEARPRFEANSDEEAKAQILKFDSPSATFVTATPPEAVAFERYLLEPHEATRPLLVDVSTHAFFAGIDVHSLYRSAAVSPLGRAEAKRERIVPPSDAKWAQRQYSMIWAPLETADLVAKREEREFGVWIHVDVVAESPSEAGVPFSAATAASAENFHVYPSKKDGNQPKPRSPNPQSELAMIDEDEE
ncbi:hypothetical protein CTAYLR_007498 [Chrysophaeum taylorii]|uniref:non-specific serine/threonine protein kinase n=1 Tax=Chrysophaeum taylorii TaxID=2483200 RepID=A0AAD7UKQ9_9STRA|nr:hypothetical protein CTAYLR_007498 [Chrysophaeum taylorii]